MFPSYHPYPYPYQVELLCRIARFHALMELAFCAAPKVSGQGLRVTG